MPIPWDKIILHGPQVLDAAKNLYGNWQTRSKQTPQDPARTEEQHSQPDKLSFRLQALEEAGEKQAELVKDLAEQNQAVVAGLRSLDAQVEDARKKFEDARNEQNNLDSRLTEFEEQLRHVHAAVSGINRKITTLILVSGSALIISIIALLFAFQR